MAGLNKVLLIGNLTRDPVMRATPGGTSICEMGLAVNRRFRTASGEDGEETCFVDIDVFGRQAEQCCRFLRKGALAFVEGRLRLDQWEDRTTKQKRSRLKVTAERVQFLDARGRDDGSSSVEAHDDSAPAAAPLGRAQPRTGAPAQAYGATRPAAPAPAEPRGDAAEAEATPADEEAVDDIPF